MLACVHCLSILCRKRYLCAHAHAHTRTHTRICICNHTYPYSLPQIYACLHIFTYIHTHDDIYVYRVCVQIHRCVCACAYVIRRVDGCSCVCVCVCINIYIHTYIHTHGRVMFLSARMCECSDIHAIIDSCFFLYLYEQPVIFTLYAGEHKFTHVSLQHYMQTLIRHIIYICFLRTWEHACLYVYICSINFRIYIHTQMHACRLYAAFTHRDIYTLLVHSFL